MTINNIYEWECTRHGNLATEQSIMNHKNIKLKTNVKNNNYTSNEKFTGNVQECTLEHIDNLTHPIHVHASVADPGGGLRGLQPPLVCIMTFNVICYY